MALHRTNSSARRNSGSNSVNPPAALALRTAASRELLAEGAVTPLEAGQDLLHLGFPGDLSARARRPHEQAAGSFGRETREEGTGPSALRRNLRLGHRFVEPAVERVQPFSPFRTRAREPHGPAGVLTLHFREHPAADTVPREGFVLVRLVLTEGNASFREELPKLGTRKGEERTDDAVAPARADASAGAAESSLEVEQDRLGLVVASGARGGI